MGNLEEMDEFLERCNLSKLNQEEIENLVVPITSTEIKTVIKKISPKTKAQDQMASQVNSAKNLEKSQHLYYPNSSRKWQRKVNS